MSGSCCGGGCCRPRSPGPAQPRASTNWLKAGLVLIVAGVVVASGLAVANQPATTDKPAPAKAPATPATSDPKAADPKATEPKPADAASPIPGVIRHGRKDPFPKPAGAIRLATFNIENLFDRPLPADEGGEGTPAKPAAHRKAIADAIKRIDADVLAVEEIESKETLLKFRDEHLKGLGYDHVASLDAGDPRGIEQAVVSRFPLEGAEVWHDLPLDAKQPEKLGKKANPRAGQPLVLKRSPLRVTVKVPADKAGGSPQTLTLFVVHHKSGPLYSFQREAEAAGIVKLAADFQKAQPGAAMAILGDFNARPREKSMQTYIAAGFTDAFGDLLEGAAQEPDEYVTHVSGRAIDHILLSPAAAAALVKDTRFVLGTVQRPEHVNWRNTDPPEGYGSDHYPVVIDLRLGQPAAAAPATPPTTPAAPQPTSTDTPRTP